MYFADSINRLTIAQAVTSENQLYTERSLPKGKSYRWLNEDDRTEIEGVLLYPPEKFEEKISHYSSSFMAVPMMRI